MDNNKILKAYSGSCLRVVVLMIGLLLTGALLLAFTIWVVLYAPLPETWRNDPAALVGITVFGMIGIGIILVIVIARIIVIRTRRMLDEVFKPLGLEAQRSFLNGGRYQGDFQDRRAEARLLRGPTLDLSITTSTKVRLGIGSRDRLLEGLTLHLHAVERIQVPDPAFANLMIASNNEFWTHRLLEDPIANRAILRLMANPGPLELRQVFFQPGSLTFRLYHLRLREISSENVRTWLGDLAAVARAAESI